MRSVAITGANGVIGTVLRDGLADFEVRALDLPECDARRYDDLLAGVRGADAIVHLAWDTVTENFRSDAVAGGNQEMTVNVYRAAREAGVPRVVMASSVHADRFWPRPPQLLTTTAVPAPDSPYGASKVFLEALGRHEAERGTEVVCIRFGGVNPADRAPADDESERAVWLSHRDCAQLVRRALEAPLGPSRYALVIGVSDNAGRVHALDNELGWEPLDGAQALTETAG